MVAPASFNEPIRSFVRVPGSGADKNLTPSCCDLSKVANIAPSSHVSSSLFTSNSNQKKTPISNNGNALKQAENKKIIKVTTNQSNVNRSNTENVSQRTNLKRQINDDNPSPPSKIARSDQTSVAAVSVGIDLKAVAELKQEYLKLQKTNKELMHKLCMFQSLFKDRTKLNEVLARLDEANAASQN